MEQADEGDKNMEQADEGDNKRIAATLTTAPLITATQAEDTNMEQDDEGDNTPIAASLLAAKKGTSQAKRKRKEKRQLWEYQPAVDSASKYWDVGIEGKRSRKLAKASYCDDDPQSQSDDDPEDEFKPQRDDAASSESDDKPNAKKKVTPTTPTAPP
jgi:hypothetical protein